MAFELGDKVFWVSQAAGRSRRKEGEVVEVVPSRTKPKTKLSATPGKSRDHESYVVKAKAIGTLTERNKVYWPLVALLQPLVPPDQGLEPVATEVGVQSILEAEDEAIREELAKKDFSPLAEPMREYIQDTLVEANDPNAPSNAFKKLLLDAADPTKQQELPPDGSFATRHVIGVDMAAKNTEMSAVVYHAEKNGVLCVVSKEEYEAYVAEMPPTIQERVDAEILANLEAEIVNMGTVKSDEKE